MDEIDPWERSKTRVQWLLSNHCNYRCSYCYDIFYKSTSPIPSDELIIEVCKEIIYHYDNLGRDVVFDFMGGEPTLVGKIPMIGQRLHNFPNNIVLKTNGSASLEWWQDSRKYLTEVVITVHREFADIDHIKKVVSLLQDETDYHPIDITLLFAVTQRQDSFDWGVENMKFFRQNYDVGDLQFLYSDFGRTNQFLPYNRMQWKHYKRSRLEHLKDDIQLTEEDLYQKGKECYAGVDTLTIDTFGNISRSWCNQEGFIGNIYKMPFVLPTEPIICKKDACKNSFDRLARKNQL